MRFNLPDRDVFRIDALADPPRESAAFAHVGTVLFNMVVNPANGTLYVSNTEARNEVRFEGPGVPRPPCAAICTKRASPSSTATTSSPRHLNKHITALPQGYRTTPMPAGVKEASLATPLDMAVASDGTLYVAAFGSSKVGVFDTRRAGGRHLRARCRAPHRGQRRRPVGAGARRGPPPPLRADPLRQRGEGDRHRDAGDEIAQHPLYNPEPPRSSTGGGSSTTRASTSSNGEASCASCHVFADFDSLAWDLGNPDDVVKPNPNPLGPTGNRAAVSPAEGADDDADAARPGAPGADALARRSHRRARSSAIRRRSTPSSPSRRSTSPSTRSWGATRARSPTPTCRRSPTSCCRSCRRPIRSAASTTSSPRRRPTAARLFLDRDVIVDKAAHCGGCHTLNASRGQLRHRSVRRPSTTSRRSSRCRS